MASASIRAELDGEALQNLIFALEYHAAARALEQIEEFKRGPGDTFRPAMFLICQSIELGLKTYLGSVGLKKSKLRYDYGHNLRRLLRLAEKGGLSIDPLTNDDREALIDANVLFSKKYLQYPHKGPHVWPDFDRVSRLAAVVIYRTITGEQLAPLFLSQDYARSVVSDLNQLNQIGSATVFQLPQLFEMADLQNDGALS